MAAKSNEGWTSIPCRPSAKDTVSDHKRDGESWSDTLERLAEAHAPQGND